MLKPKVGLMVSIGSPLIRFKMVVLPALSSPRNKILSSRSLTIVRRGGRKERRGIKMERERERGDGDEINLPLTLVLPNDRQ